MATIDVVTRVYNRIYLTNVMQQQTKLANSVTACCIIDLDNFKALNDSYGHAFGDQVLAQVGRCLRKTFSDTDTLFGRWGGEEFLLMSWGDKKQLRQQLATFNQLLSEIHQDTDKPPITASVGMAINPAGNPWTAHECIELADQLMYQGKGHGKDSIVMGCVI